MKERVLSPEYLSVLSQGPGPRKGYSWWCYIYRLSQPALALSGGSWAPGHLAQSALSRPFWRIALEFCGCSGRWRTCPPGHRGSRRWRRSTTPSPRSTDRGQYPWRWPARQSPRGRDWGHSTQPQLSSKAAKTCTEQFVAVVLSFVKGEWADSTTLLCHAWSENNNSNNNKLVCEEDCKDGNSFLRISKVLLYSNVRQRIRILT